MTFTCVEKRKRWKLTDHTCKKKSDPPPACSKTNYKVKIGDEKMLFELLAAENGETEEEDCADSSDGELEGSLTFKCDGDAKRWTLSEQNCQKPEEPEPICKKTTYRVKLGKTALKFKLPAADDEVERKEDCGGGMSGKITFACREKAKRWRIINHACKEGGEEKDADEEEEEEDEDSEEEPPVCRKTSYKVKI